MVRFAPLFGAAALFSSLVAGLPTTDPLDGKDSSINEPAVSAPNGIPITASLTTTVAAAATSSAAAEPMKEGGMMAEGMKEEPMKEDAKASYGTPSYGSGSSNWNNESGSSYDGCVQQCMSQFGSPPSSYKPPTPTAKVSAGTGNGATHTVIVAPTQGVLRYIPFALNASVGDTIKFMWGANNHTVTKSSQLQLCNKTSDSLFTSGSKNKDFIFTQVVNDTNPTYFFCNTPGHCQKGMFGIINPPSAFGGASSVGKQMASLTSSDANMAAMLSYTNKQTAGNTKANNWGSSIDMDKMPEWSKKYVAENTMYTRTFLAANPEVIQQDGSVELSSAGDTPMMIPQDISVAVSAASTSSSGSTPGSPSGSSAAAEPSVSGGAANAVGAATTNGAGSLSSPKVLVGVMAAIVAFLAL